MVSNALCCEFLVALSNVLVVLPPTTLKSCKTFKIYAIICVFMTTSVFVYSSVGRCLKVYSKTEEDENVAYLVPVLAILDQVSQSMLHLSHLISSVYLSFCQEKSYVNFHLNVRKLNEALEIPWKTHRNLYKLFLFLSVLVLITVCYDGFVWLKSLGIGMYQFYLWKSVQFVQCFFNCFVMYAYCVSIAKQFEKINKDLVRIMNKKFETESAIYYNEIHPNSNATNAKNCANVIEISCNDSTTYVNNLKFMINVHNEACNLVDSFNDIFGINILIIVFSSIVNVLFNSGLFAAFGGLRTGGEEIDTSLKMTRFLWITSAMLFPVMLGTACEGAEKEAKKIVPISTGYLNRGLPANPNGKNPVGEIETVQKCLYILREQALIRSPIFSAAGFFNVNFTMMGFIIGSVTSYIIVTLQLVPN